MKIWTNVLLFYIRNKAFSIYLMKNLYTLFDQAEMWMFKFYNKDEMECDIFFWLYSSSLKYSRIYETMFHTYKTDFFLKSS